MPGQFDQREDGEATVFSVRRPMWHQEGRLLSRAPSLAEAIRIAGHDFEVQSRPLYTRRVVNDGRDAVHDLVPDHRAVVRTDRSTTLGIVGRHYTPLQNADAFAVLEPLLDAGVAHLETGGTLFGGADVWMAVRFDLGEDVRRDAFGDEVVTYGVVTNNHAGERGATVLDTQVRVVCANTLQLALRRAASAIRVRHTRGVRDGVRLAAAELWAAMGRRQSAAAELAGRLRARHLTDVQFADSVLDVLAPEVRAFNGPGPRRLKAAETARVRRARLTELWTGGDGHAGDHSAWEAYNAAAQSLDHDTAIWTTRGNGGRVGALLYGALGRGKRRVLERLAAI